MSLGERHTVPPLAFLATGSGVVDGFALSGTGVLDFAHAEQARPALP